MSSSRFKAATREQSRLRAGFCGPSGSGKSVTMLRMANQLKKLIEQKLKRPARIAVIESEHGSIKKYVGDKFSEDESPFEFDVLELKNFAPTEYTTAIHDAGRDGYDILIVDSLSHAWTGTGGALEIKDNAGSDFFGWKTVTPMHNKMIEAILTSPCHVFASLRSKTEWVIEKDPQTGKNVPRKIGTEPVQRKGMEYEFDIFGEIDQSHILTINKSRCSAVQDLVVSKPGPSLMNPIYEWLVSGVAGELPAESMKREMASDEAIAAAVKMMAEQGLDLDKVKDAMEAKFGCRRMEDLTAEQLKTMTEGLEENLAKKKRLDEIRAKKKEKSTAALATATNGNGKPTESPLVTSEFMASIDRPTTDTILAELDKKGLSWPEARKNYINSIGGNPDLISGVDSLSQEQGLTLLRLITGPPSDNLADKLKKKKTEQTAQTATTDSTT